MKNIFIVIILLLTITSGHSQSPSWSWAFGVGGLGTEHCESITRDNSGNLFTTGYFSDAVDFDPGPNDFTMLGYYDIFILKTDSNKNFIWAKRIGFNNLDSGTSIICDDSSNIYVTGYYRDNVDFDPGPGIFNMYSLNRAVFVLKLDSSGAFQWAKSISGQNSPFLGSTRIRRDVNCNLFIGGYFQDSVDFDPGVDTVLVGTGQYDKVFILKLTNQGDFIWVKVLGAPNANVSLAEFQDMDVNKDGEVVVTGYFQKNIDLDPGPDTLLLDANIGQDAFICKLDTAGNFQWGFAYGNNNNNVLGQTIAFDSTGNIFTSGTFAGNLDADPGAGIILINTVSSAQAGSYLIKLNGNGEYIWSQVMEHWVSRGIASDALNNLYITGNFSDSVDFNPDPNLSFILVASGSNDVFVSKSDSNGVFNWAIKAGGPSWDLISRAELGNSNDIYVAGTFNGLTASFAPYTIQNGSNPATSNPDGFVARLFNLQTGLNEVKSDQELSVFPNPATNAIQLIIDCPGDIIIYDVLGNVLFQRQFSEKVQKQIELDISYLTAGIYFVKAGNKVSKFIKL